MKQQQLLQAIADTIAENEPLFGYEVHVVRAIYHNKRFSHNQYRSVVVHLTESQIHEPGLPMSEVLKLHVDLLDEESNEVDEHLIITASKETFDGFASLGRVHYNVEVAYE